MTSVSVVVDGPKRDGCGSESIGGAVIVFGEVATVVTSVIANPLLPTYPRSSVRQLPRHRVHAVEWVKSIDWILRLEICSGILSLGPQ